MTYMRNAMKTIIAAVDFSDATPVVVHHAVNIAKTLGAELQLFHAVEPEPGYVTYGFGMAEFSPMDAVHVETRRRAIELMQRFLADVRARFPHTTSRIREGAPLPELLKQINECGADLVIVGTHGHGAISSLLLGSVADGMIRKSPVPILTIPIRPN